MSLLGRVCIPMVPEPGRARQEDFGSKVSLGYTAKHCLHLPTPLKLVSHIFVCLRVCRHVMKVDGDWWKVYSVTIL